MIAVPTSPQAAHPTTHPRLCATLSLGEAVVRASRPHLEAVSIRTSIALDLWSLHGLEAWSNKLPACLRNKVRA